MRKIKYMLFAILPLLFSLTLYGESKGVIERVYVSTDKGSYVSGDGVGCSLYCFQIGDNGVTLSPFSSVAYMELVSSEGVVQQEKITLIDGRGGAVLKLSPSLPTGNYKLVAYTRQNRNEQGFVPFSKDISIYNTLLTDKIKGNVEVSEPSAEGPAGTFVENSGNIRVHCSEAAPSSLSNVKIENLSGEEIFFNVSVYHRDILARESAGGMEALINEGMKSAGKEVSDSYVPDFEGEVIHFKSDAAGKKMLLSFPGKGGNVYISDVDSLGNIYFYAGSIYGEKDGMLQVMPGYSDRRHNSEMVSPFIGSFDFEFPKLRINKEMEEDLVARSIGMQVNRRFGMEALHSHLEQRGDPFLGTPDKSYLLDDYTRFHTLQEVITEYVSNVRIRTLGDKRLFSVLYKDAIGNETFSKFSTLALLDGMPVFNHEDILAYDPMLVKQIRVYTSSYRISDITYEGIICFDTYKGDIPSFPMDSTSKVFAHKGSLYPESITGEGLYLNSDIPDYRNTIYWHPLLSLKKGDVLEFDCVTPKYRGIFDIVIEGVTSSGKVICYKTSFQVK